MDDFEFISKIGSGSYGTVYRAFDHSKKVYKAVKKFKKIYNSINECKEEIEVQILPLLKHSNIINLNKIIFDNEHLYLIMDLARIDLGRYY